MSIVAVLLVVLSASPDAASGNAHMLPIAWPHPFPCSSVREVWSPGEVSLRSADGTKTLNLEPEVRVPLRHPLSWLTSLVEISAAGGQPLHDQVILECPEGRTIASCRRGACEWSVEFPVQGTCRSQHAGQLSDALRKVAKGDWKKKQVPSELLNSIRNLSKEAAKDLELICTTGLCSTTARSVQAHLQDGEPSPQRKQSRAKLGKTTWKATANGFELLFNAPSTFEAFACNTSVSKCWLRSRIPSKDLVLHYGPADGPGMGFVFELSSSSERFGKGVALCEDDGARAKAHLGGAMVNTVP